MGVGGQRHAPAALPPGKTRNPLYRRLGEHRGRSGRQRKISPPHGFDPRTVQPVASRYTDWAIPARLKIYVVIFILLETTRKISHWMMVELTSWRYCAGTTQGTAYPAPRIVVLSVFPNKYRIIPRNGQTDKSKYLLCLKHSPQSGWQNEILLSACVTKNSPLYRNKK